MFSARWLSPCMRSVVTAWSLFVLLAACASPAQTSVTPRRIAVDARPNGIAVRPADGAVFITDDKTNAILSSNNGDTFTPFAQVPPVAGQPASLSQIAFTDSGSLLAERFGFGSASAIFEISGTGPATAFTGIDPARRRLGLIPIGDGQVLSSWFVKVGAAPPQGGVSLVVYDPSTHAARERILLAGLGKPVGMAVSGDALFIADQQNNVVIKASLAALSSHAGPRMPIATLAHIDGPDLMAIDANGALYTKCNATGLCRIAPDGTVSVIASDFQDARGVAVDAAHSRLFAIDRAHSAGGQSYVRIFPLK
jgi:hypothetical protein